MFCNRTSTVQSIYYRIHKYDSERCREELQPITDRSSLFQLVTQGGHGSLHALIFLPLALEDRCFGLNLLDDLIQDPANSPGLLFLKLELCLTLCICIVQLKKKQKNRGGGVNTFWYYNKWLKKKKDCRQTNNFTLYKSYFFFLNTKS